jgi:hypothetical protein
MPNFKAPLFGGSDGFAYLIDEETLPGIPFRCNDGMDGLMPKVVLSKYGNTVYNPKHIQREEKLDSAWSAILEEYNCHGDATTTGQCQACGKPIQIWVLNDKGAPVKSQGAPGKKKGNL